MRSRFKPTPEQRAALRAQMARLQQPAASLELLRSVLPWSYFQPATVVCTPQSVHPDRFVLRAQLHSANGEERSYALKVYSDDFVARLWMYAKTLANRCEPKRNGLCLPIAYLAHERMLVFPWVAGRYLSEIVDERKQELLRMAAQLAADLHRLDVVPEPLTTPAMFVEETLARCERLENRWPQTRSLVQPLTDALQEALTCLRPASPCPVHGDLAAGQFLWTGDRLVLLDLDMFGYADPAYDVGHFLAQLERRCLWDSTVRSHASHWQACFRDAYFAAMPEVFPQNVTFYHGLTLARKIYTLCRTQREEWPSLVPKLAARARAALEEVAAAELAE